MRGIDKKHLNKFILTKEFLKHSQSHIRVNDSINLSLALLSIDNAFEYFIKTLASLYEVDYSYDESLKSIYINTSKKIQQITGKGLPWYSRFEPLRVVRNYIQHENSITFNDAEKFYDLIEDFIKLQIKTMFNLDYETLDIIDLIKSDNIRSLLKKACETWEINKMQAMSILRDAFDNSKREYLYELYSWDYVNIYTMATRRDIEHEIRRMLIQNTESLILSSIGIDLIQYKNYGVIIDYINGDYRSDYHGGPVMHDNEEYTNKQFEYVKEFVIDSIIRMQEKQEITKIIDLHKRPRDYFININERKWTLNDNEFIMDEKSFISIGPRKNEIT
mgnify:CR=1 FL=1